MKHLVIAIILAVIGIVGCCAGENNQYCYICDQDRTPYDQKISAGDITKPSQAYWAWDCFTTCLSMRAPTSKQGKIAQALGNTCQSKGCRLCRDSGLTNWPACIACVGCVSVKVGYNIGYAAICGQECLKNRR